MRPFPYLIGPVENMVQRDPHLFNTLFAVHQYLFFSSIDAMDLFLNG